MNIVELLIGIAEIATALAGFTGVVVAFGSRSEGAWHPGDRLRLGFLLEASLTAGGFMTLIVLQLINAAVWHRFSPFLAAVTLNLAGAAMQFARLIRSAFRD